MPNFFPLFGNSIRLALNRRPVTTGINFPSRPFYYIWNIIVKKRRKERICHQGFLREGVIQYGSCIKLFSFPLSTRLNGSLFENAFLMTRERVGYVQKCWKACGADADEPRLFYMTDTPPAQVNLCRGGAREKKIRVGMWSNKDGTSILIVRPQLARIWRRPSVPSAIHSGVPGGSHSYRALFFLPCSCRPTMNIPTYLWSIRGLKNRRRASCSFHNRPTMTAMRLIQFASNELNPAERLAIPRDRKEPVQRERGRQFVEWDP